MYNVAGGVRMDSIERMLCLYLRLDRGEKIKKNTFCKEIGCSGRTFDRDMKMIRQCREKINGTNDIYYDRKQSSYNMKYITHRKISLVEYQMIEKILIDSRTLKKDEIEIVIRSLLQNTEDSQKIEKYTQKKLNEYNSPLHNKELLSLCGSIEEEIRNRKIIKIKYQKNTGELIERSIIPCMIKYTRGNLYLIAFIERGDYNYPAYYRLDRIDSFRRSRNQKVSEEEIVKHYMNRYANGIIEMMGGSYQKIRLRCSNRFYEYVYEQFPNVEVIQEKEEYQIVDIEAFDEGFVKWILGQPYEHVQVISPIKIREQIIQELEKKIKYYKENA